MQFNKGFILILCCFLCSCAVKKKEVAPLEKYEYPAENKEKEKRISRTGSLWTNGQGGLFSDIRAREEGDIVTVAIYESSSANHEAETSTQRGSSASADLSSVFGLENNIATINDSINPTSLVGAGYDTTFDGSGSTSREENLQATLTTRIVRIMPDGNLKIQGNKRITINNEDQIIRLTGIVRPEDITAHNMIDSKYVLNANIDYQGSGVISDKQKPGWLMRLMDNVWPF